MVPSQEDNSSMMFAGGGGNSAKEGCMVLWIGVSRETCTYLKSYMNGSMKETIDKIAMSL